MPKKPAKSSAKKARKSSTVKDLPAKSLGASKAASVKGGAGADTYLKISGSKSLKIDNLKIDRRTGFKF